jgi:preprotein translocase subunit SecE
MKKKKGSKKRSTRKRSQSRSSEKTVQQKPASREEVSEGKAPSEPAVRKELPKKADDREFFLKRYISIARQFLSDAKVELKKVTWPNRKELVSTTAIVIVLVLIIAFFLGIIDLGLVKIIKNVIR